jgi:CRP/FNR family transcriptional regulator
VDLSKLLTQISIFAHLDQDEIRSLIDFGITRQYRTDEWIVYQGDTWPYLFVVIDGEVIAVKESMQGRSLILESFSSGEIFWGLTFFLEDVPMPAGLRASRNCALLLWSQERVASLLKRDGRLSWALSQVVLQRALRASDIVDGLAFQPVAGRLARLLVEQFGETEGEIISRDLTLDEMAAYIGTTREMVSRILHRFSHDGIIEITRTEFVFTDWDKLRQFAQKTGV